MLRPCGLPDDCGRNGLVLGNNRGAWSREVDWHAKRCVKDKDEWSAGYEFQESPR